ncbi:MAG: hypothetical protein MK008_09970 [Bdellovibrionales bacterium]|nr:hypothetical protein [Bdellovibrionales bacterium]
MYKLILLILVMFSLNSYGADKNSQWGSLFTFEMDFGGDEVDSFSYSDGTTSSLSAGRGLYLGYGRSYTINKSKQSLSTLYGSIGWKFATIKEASNGDVTWSRFPIEFGYSYYHLPWSLRGAIGLNYIPESSISASGAASGSSADMGSSSGYFAQLEYMLGYHLGFGLKFGFNEFENKDSAKKYSADYIGLNLNFYWGDGISSSRKSTQKESKRRELSPEQRRKLLDSLKNKKKQQKKNNQD